MQDQVFPFKVEPLPFPMNAVEPNLDSSLMESHVNEIYNRDVIYLNSIVAQMPSIQTWTVPQIILYQIRNEPVLNKNAAKFYAGSKFNHDLYFRMMTTPGSTRPSGPLLEAINRRYGSVKQMLDLLKDAAVSLLGPGWVWLNSERDGGLHIAQTQENDTPQLSAVTPIFTADMWEHAYMPQYGNRIGEYIQNWFGTINWDLANARFEASLIRQKPDQFVSDPQRPAAGLRPYRL